MSWLISFGDELSNFLIIVVSSVILYAAWLSTNTQDESIPNGSILIMNRTRHQILPSVNSPNSIRVSIVRNPGQPNSRANSTETETEEIFLPGLDDPTEGNRQTIEIARPPSLQSILAEVGNLNAGDEADGSFEEIDDNRERREIIRDMDRVDSDVRQSDDGLRQRRTPMTERDYAEAGPSSRSHPPMEAAAPENVSPSLGRSNSTDLAANTENCTNENSENGNVLDESVVAATIEATSSAENPTTDGDDAGEASVLSQVAPGDEFRIKLKYLNDDLKLVKGSPNEHIGDFMKRNFTAELSNNKVVRLVFNGHVLQPDTKTLLACGMFDNCVVHCLVHNPRPVQPTANDAQGFAQAVNMGRERGLGLGQVNGENDRMEGQDRRLDTGILLLTLTLGFGLYVRFQHIQLFTTNPMYGYALVLALFAIIFGIVYMVDRGTRMMYSGALMLALTMSFSYYMRFQHSNLFTFYSTVGLVLLTVMLVMIMSVVFTVQHRHNAEAARQRPNQPQRQPPVPPAGVDVI